jgi:cardiolipin synthase (CMP-forming)
MAGERHQDGGSGEGDAPSPWNLANALTALRFVLAPTFLALYLHGERVRALAAFAAAAATDVLDGLVARVLHQHTRLGAFLDPIADKFLAACALFALVPSGRLPLWLPVLVVTRDLFQLLGAAVLRTLHHRIPVLPTRIGKYATFALAAAVLTALAGEFGALPPGPAASFVAVFGLMAAECLCVSWVQYFLFFLRAVRAEAA